MQARLKRQWPYSLRVCHSALGVSELAVGILWYSIFTQPGFLNSFLQGIGVSGAPFTFLSADTRYWILIAIWLAEVWRATSIMMVIVVSGLQGISDEVLEAAEIFGAGLMAASQICYSAYAQAQFTSGSDFAHHSGLASFCGGHCP